MTGSMAHVLGKWRRQAGAASMAVLLVLAGCQGKNCCDTLTVTQQPASVTVQDGQSATFTVAAEVGGPFTYQWSRGEQLIDGATKSEYSVVLAYADNGAKFKAFVKNSLNQGVWTNDAIATVKAMPIKFVVPVSQVVVAAVGGSVRFGDQVESGSLPRSHQWHRNGLPVPGATAATYVLGTITLADEGAQFNVVVTNPAGTFASTPLVVSVSQ